MKLETIVNELTDSLSRAAYLEPAADLLLCGIRDLMSYRLSETFESTEIKRVAFQFRDVNGNYVSSVECEMNQEQQQNHQDLEPSATAWSLINQHRLPVSIDVLERVALIIGNLDKDLVTQLEDATKTIQSLTARSTTHVLALPLLSEDRVCGAITIELASRDTIGSHEVSLIIAPEIETVLFAVAPYFSSITTQPSEADQQKMLPVSSHWAAHNQRLFEIFATQEQAILITGPTGSGKTHLARWIHEQDPKRLGEFVVAPLNEVGDETSLPQLFGWKRGSFTGATSDHAGWLESAQGGTIFLDDIDGLSLKQQEGLLRLLDSQTYRRMGENRDRQLKNTRIICATNGDIETLVVDGMFREDLYHRINMFRIQIPKLQERVDEISHWAKHHLKDIHATSNRSGSARFSDQAISALSKHSWPGNLRELYRTILSSHAFSQVRTELTENLVIDASDIRQVFESLRPSNQDNPAILLETTAKSIYLHAKLTGDFSIPKASRRGLLFDAVWMVALIELGDNRAARTRIAELLDVEALIRSRNYTRELRKALGVLKIFFATHGKILSPEVERILVTENRKNI